jgi:hypothetical protein
VCVRAFVNAAINQDAVEAPTPDAVRFVQWVSGSTQMMWRAMIRPTTWEATRFARSRAFSVARLSESATTIPRIRRPDLPISTIGGP